MTILHTRARHSRARGPAELAPPAPKGRDANKSNAIVETNKNISNFEPIEMYSIVLILLIILIIFYIYQKFLNQQQEGLGTQNKLPAYFTPFTLNNMPLKMTYWANRLNGDPTTGNIDPYTVANDLKTTARTMNIILYGDENGVNQKFIGMMSSIPFTINNLPVKMNVWANRLNGDPTGGTMDPQSIANEIQICSTLMIQALNGSEIPSYDMTNQFYEIPPIPEPEPEPIPEPEPEIITTIPSTTFIPEIPSTTFIPETTPNTNNELTRYSNNTNINGNEDLTRYPSATHSDELTRYHYSTIPNTSTLRPTNI